jgi:hypothetical protein
MYIGGKKIETVKKFRYLGIMLYNDAIKPE